MRKPQYFTPTTVPKADLVGCMADFTPAEIRAVKEYGPFLVCVRIIGARRAYGRDELLIQPVGGSGCAWVSLKSLRIRP